jgi:hypothetical protein
MDQGNNQVEFVDGEAKRPSHGRLKREWNGMELRVEFHSAKDLGRRLISAQCKGP